MGIVQAPPKEKKRWDREDPEEARRRRKEKAIARGEPYSDSYDDETDGGDADVSGINDPYSSAITNSQSDLVGKTGKSLMHDVMAARNKVIGNSLMKDNEVELQCPEGYDVLKWATMSRKEKLKVLGITEKEWDAMSREQQMKRMNKLAHGFHFYIMDNKNRR